MPPTSLVVPLLGKYLVFTIQMVTLSIFLTIITINIHNKTPTLHKPMSHTIRTIFLNKLPKFLFLNEDKGEEYYLAQTKQNFLQEKRQNLYSLESIKTRKLMQRSNLYLHSRSINDLYSIGQKNSKPIAKNSNCLQNKSYFNLIAKNITYLDEIVKFIENEVNTKKVI
jgi:nicotinic acetylcholine receptor